MPPHVNAAGYRQCGLDKVELDGQGWLTEGLPGVGEHFGFDAAVQCG
jgi:hypothetical protein